MIKHQDCESSYPVSDLQGINSELNLELTNSSPNAAGRTSWEGPAITARLTRDIRSPHSEVWRKMNWGSRARLPRRQGLVVSPRQCARRAAVAAAGRIIFIGGAVYRFALQKSGNEVTVKLSH